MTGRIHESHHAPDAADAVAEIIVLVARIDGVSLDQHEVTAALLACDHTNGQHDCRVTDLVRQRAIEQGKTWPGDPRP